MQFKTTVLATLALTLLAQPSRAQNPPAPAATARAVIAATKLPSVIDKPLYFTATMITLAPGSQQTIAAENGVLYQLSGSADVSTGGESKTLASGTGILIAAGQSAALKTSGGEPSTSLHFQLVPSASGGGAGASANMKELFRTSQPVAGLKSGTYDLNFTRVTFPAGMPSNPPHHRTGAALCYVISGNGANIIEGKTEMRGPGSLIYEPGGLVHQWCNPGPAPLTFLTFNINQEGTPAVAQDPPGKSP